MENSKSFEDWYAEVGADLEISNDHFDRHTVCPEFKRFSVPKAQPASAPKEQEEVNLTISPSVSVSELSEETRN